MFCQQNDAYQMDAIGVEYLDGLYGYAFVLSGNRADAENLVKQTYVRAMQAMERVRTDSNKKSSFFKILRTIWVNLMRERRSGTRLFETELGGPSESSSSFYVGKTERETLRAAIQELRVEFREVIVLRECEGLSFQEIASIVDCPAETVKSQLAAARSMLHILLSARWKRFEMTSGSSGNSGHPRSSAAR